MKSDDYGKSWRKIPVPVTGRITGMAFASPSRGFATGAVNGFLETLDGGGSWKKAPGSKFGSTFLTDCYFFDPDTGFFVGPNYGILYRTENGPTPLFPAPIRLPSPSIS